MQTFGSRTYKYYWLSPTPNHDTWNVHGHSWNSSAFMISYTHELSFSCLRKSSQWYVCWFPGLGIVFGYFIECPLPYICDKPVTFTANLRCFLKLSYSGIYVCYQIIFVWILRNNLTRYCVKKLCLDVDGKGIRLICINVLWPESNIVILQTEFSNAFSCMKTFVSQSKAKPLHEQIVAQFIASQGRN